MPADGPGFAGADVVVGLVVLAGSVINGLACSCRIVCEQHLGLRSPPQSLERRNDTRADGCLDVGGGVRTMSGPQPECLPAWICSEVCILASIVE